MPAPESNLSPSSDPVELSERDPLGPVRALTNPYAGMGRKAVWKRRIKELPLRPSTCFHLMSRLCEGVPFFDETEKEALVIVLRKLARFCGLKLLTYCVMGNHFHALVRVPERGEWLRRFEGVDGEDKLLRHLRLLYSRSYVESLRLQLAEWRRQGNEAEAKRCVDEMKRRFCDISVFMNAVKLRFSRWYNKRHGRRGALWMGRFKSVLVEDRQQTARQQTSDKRGRLDALKVMAAYIDLNPVRAGLVERAELYRWSGWGAALGGDKEAVEGLCDVVGCPAAQWEKRAREGYGQWLAVGAGDGGTEGMREGENEGVELLGRVRAFTRGLAVGSREFVEEVFEGRRELFGSRRKQGARPLDGGGEVVRRGLCALRQV